MNYCQTFNLSSKKPSVAEHVSQLISRKFGIQKDPFEHFLAKKIR